jgi:type IV pilus assembly protein PilV
MPRIVKHTNSKKRLMQRGMTLIEVLVAILIFSFGLVGLVALQARALQYSTSAEDTNRAALLASEAVAQMTLKDTLSLDTSDLQAWKTQVATPASGGLPNGVGDIATAGGTATVTITWRAPNAAPGAANADNKYVTQFKLVK